MFEMGFQHFETVSQSIVSFLIREALYATLVCLIVLFLQKMLPMKHLSFRIGLWSLVFIRLILPPDLAHPLSGRSLLNRWLDRPNQVTTHSFIETDPVPDPGESTAVGFSSKSRDTVFHWDYRHLFFLIWILGLLFLIPLYFKKLFRYHRIIRDGNSVRHKHALEKLNIWKTRFGIRRSVKLLTLDSVAPFTMGTLKPVIVIPEYLMEDKHLSDLESVLAHELAHIRRFDDLWIKLQNGLQILYFFHPVVWIAGSKLQLARECACDSLVLSQEDIKRETYAHGLLNILKINTLGPDCVTLIPSFSSERNNLLKRLKHMKGEHNMRGKHKLGMIALMIGLAVFILPMATSQWKPIPSGPALEAATIAVIAAMVADNTSSTATDDTDKASGAVTFVPPVEGGTLTDQFGNRRHPIKQYIQMHNGVDIADRKGTPVYAACEGIVRFAGKKGDYGNLITIDHAEGYITKYAQLENILVKSGEKVKQRQQIGTVGSSGLSTGPHLHFELIHDEDHLDPQSMIKFDAGEEAVDPEGYLKD